jgi:hypothetical protein
MQTQQIGKLKNDLSTKGYTFFNINDLEEFREYYELYKKYICNQNSNLKENFNCLRMDGVFKRKSFISNENPETYQYQSRFESHDDVKNFVNSFFEENKDKIDNNSMSQYWYYSDDKHQNIRNQFNNLFDKIVNCFYNEDGRYSIKHSPTLTYYDKGCFLKKHQDGQTQNRICAILFYLNEEYKLENGGNLILAETDVVLPIYGNIAIIDFTQGNAMHEVTKVVDGIGRYAVLSFSNTQNEKYIVK